MGDQPLPGPSTGPIPAKDVPSSAHQRQGQPGHTRGGGDKSVNKKQSALVLTERERDRLTPLISTNTQKHTTPALTRGYKTGEKGQQKSVLRQEPEGQHPRQGKTTDPKSVREWASGSGGHSYQPLQCLQDRHRRGLHLHPREQESERDNPPSKALKPFRLTRPREQESERDKPPSKVLKSVQWMKSLLGRRHGAEKEGKDSEEGGENGSQTPVKKDEVEPDPEVEPDLDPNPEQGLDPEHLSPTLMEE